MRLLTLFTFLFSSLAFAAVPQHVTSLLARAVLAQDAESDDEDEEDAPGAQPAPAPTATPTPSAAPVAPAPAPGAVQGASPVSSAESQRLVSGAPLFNPNVAVHIVEKKQFADVGKREIVLYPAAIQANGKFTQHIGSALTGVYHLHENFGLQASGQYNWFATESGFNGELIEKVRQEAQAASSLLLVWGAQAGVEVTPLYGKFAFYSESLGHFSLVLNGGAGLGSTRHQLKPANTAGPASYGETGLKFMGSLGAGFRLQLGDNFALRLEVRDLVYTARVDAVNGCDGVDLAAMDRALRAGQKVTTAAVTPSCKVETFDGTDENTTHNRRDDVPLALNLVRVPSSDVLNNVGFYAGFAFLF